MIRVGKVSSIDVSIGAARVAFPDTGTVSKELPVLKNAWPLQVGQQVFCLFLPTGYQQGVILGTFYTADDPPLGGV